MISPLNPFRVVWFEVLVKIIMVEFLGLFYPLFRYYLFIYLFSYPV